MFAARSISRRNANRRRIVALQLLRDGAIGAGAVFSRATSGTYRNASGVLAAVTSNLPRFVGSDKALLMEPMRENEKVNSADITAEAGWQSNQFSSYTRIASAGPDGTSTVSQIVASSSGNASGYYFGSIAVTQGALTAHSMFLKNISNASAVRMGLDPCHAFFNLQTGTVVSTAGCIAWTEPYANGWWRCFIVYAAPESGLYPVIYNGNSGACTFQAFGLQVEAGGFATSYANSPSQGTGVRTQDHLYLPITSAQGVEGSVTLDFTVQPNSGSVSRNVLDIADANSNELYVNVGTNGFVFMGFGTNNGATYTYTAGTAITPGAVTRLAVGWSNGTASMSVNRGAIQTMSGGVTSPYSRIGIGCNPYFTSVELGGTLNNVLLYPTRMSDAQLIAA